MFRLKLRPRDLRCPLQLGHHFQTVLTRRAGRHREVPGHHGLLGRVEKAPLHLTRDDLGYLKCEQHENRRRHGVAGPQNKSD